MQKPVKKKYNLKPVAVSALCLLSLLMLDGCVRGAFLLGGYHYHNR